MAYTYSITPSIGIARVGNSPDEFYLAPETTGGLPIACDAQGNAALVDGQPQLVHEFKDAAGRIKRQAAAFKILRFDTDKPNVPGQELTLDNPDVAAIEWTVHIANKKAAWYQFQELQGDLMYGQQNSYAACDVPLRNAGVTGDARQKLIIDPGPRTLSEAKGCAQFSQDTIPPDYTFGSFPPPPTQGYAITTLGEMLTDSQGRLRVLGGFGKAGGNQSISTFAGADTWHDDIADGQVTCSLKLQSGESVQLSAWVIVGSPKFAPELINIVTLDDIMYDVSVRYQSMIPDLFDSKRWPASGGWNPDYRASYTQDIEPLIRRMGDYRWVANVPGMVTFFAPPFNPADAGEGNRQNRETYFSYFRRPADLPNGQNMQLLSESGIPLMPDNSGSNSVSNTLLDKFLTLTDTQYFLLGQWAQGKFSAEDASPIPGVEPLDRSSVGNCVGSPMCPGIEVTWSMRNPAIYARGFQIATRADQQYYFAHGLDPNRDECEGGGCEPGDLTKRMAIPWQADFFQCTMQYINFTDPHVNKADGIPAPPTYYAYWWPPQSPMHVVSGASTDREQALTGNPYGMQVFYPRGINSFAQMIAAWSYLGFIVNVSTSPDRTLYPYFVERERNNERFAMASVAVGGISNVITAEDVVFMPVFYLKEEDEDEERASIQGFAAVPRDSNKPVRGPAHRRMHL